MSNQEVVAALEEMEARLANPDDLLEGGSLKSWHQKFQTAVATAEKGPGWQSIVARAHALGDQVKSRQGAVEAQREAVRHELEQQSAGGRALKGYGLLVR